MPDRAPADHLPATVVIRLGFEAIADRVERRSLEEI